jgi:hypothetical protein
LTPPDDYVGEMIARHQIDDATAEALLAGSAVSGDLRPLAEVVHACRRMARQPVRPSATLARRIAAGAFPRPAGRYRAPAAGSGHRRRRTLTRTAWIAVTGGVVAAVAGVGTAGFAGVLPDQAQERFEDVVETVTPYEFPLRGNENDRNRFGEEVSEDARDGGVDGGEIGERAREQGDEHRPVDPPAEPGVPPDLPAPARPDHPGPGRPGPGDVPAPPASDRRPAAPPGR